VFRRLCSEQRARALQEVATDATLVWFQAIEPFSPSSVISVILPSVISVILLSARASQPISLQPREMRFVPRDIWRYRAVPPGSPLLTSATTILMISCVSMIPPISCHGVAPGVFNIVPHSAIAYCINKCVLLACEHWACSPLGRHPGVTLADRPNLALGTNAGGTSCSSALRQAVQPYLVRLLARVAGVWSTPQLP